MPNWVFNNITIEGDTAEVERLVQQVGRPFTIPNSQVTEKVGDKWGIVRKDVHYSNPVFAFWNIVAPTDLEAYNGTHEHHAAPNQTPAEMLAEIAHGFEVGNDWYNWNVRNWGTKWDVAVRDDEAFAEVQIAFNKSDGDKSVVSYHFNTAWGPAVEAIATLSEQYPTLTFDYDYEEEQGWGGELTIKAGQVTVNGEWDIPESHADYVALDREDSCICNWENPEMMFEDCPGFVAETIDNDQTASVE